MSLVRADSIHIPLADNSVDLIVTSPPYFALRSYQDDGEHYDGQIGSEPTPRDFLEALWSVTDECWRVLKSGGSMFVNLGDKMGGSGGHNNAGVGGSGRGPSAYNKASDVRVKSLEGLPWRYALGCSAPHLYRAPFESATCWHDDGPGPCRTCPPSVFPQWVARAEIVWSKPNGLPESVNDRVRRSHEQWFHMVKSPRYYAAVDEVREEQTDPEQRRALAGDVGRLRRGPSGINRSTSVGVAHDDGRAMGAFVPNPLGKLPGSVWTIPSEPLVVPEHIGVDHFAAFPQEWPRRLILGWSPSGICTACGEGRAPVVKATPMVVTPSARRAAAHEAGAGGGRTLTSGTMTQAPERTITGYACACPDTSAPTRPAVVLDPFGGTGTVAMVARALGRYPVHIDLSADYLRLARWRIYQSGHARKAVARTNRERQTSLFGGTAA